jgi:diaminohydroxyphosphoribosylaminopyrimidine deaminase/5-amino-6-(5-phosphoribosylamino)uracil reductase
VAEAAAGGDDRRFMQRALELALRGWGQTSPNPLVGAVLVRDGRIVAEGWHAHFGGPHAEVAAIEAAGREARGTTLYVTLEPCRHHGKTPPCVDAILAAGVSRVVAAVRDPTEAGGGAELLAQAGVAVEIGLLAEEARELNAPFFHAAVARRPWVTLKYAVSLDGCISDRWRTRGWITGEEARRKAHWLRAGSDAVAVGMGTVLADDPELTVREAVQPRRPPLRVVFSRYGRLPLTSRLAQTAHAIPVVVFAADPDPSYEHALRDLDVEVVQALSLRAALENLFDRGVRSLLVEGGALLGGALLSEGLVDRLVLLRSPVILGEGALGAFSHAPSARVLDAARYRVVQRGVLGSDDLVILAVREL